MVFLHFFHISSKYKFCCYLLWGHWVHSGYFEDLVPLKTALEAYESLQTANRESPNKPETPFMFLIVFIVTKDNIYRIRLTIKQNPTEMTILFFWFVRFLKGCIFIKFMLGIFVLHNAVDSASD